MVYLTDTYPFFFTNIASTPWVVVFEIDTDRLNHEAFFPDEDYLAQVANELGIVPNAIQNINEVALARLLEFQTHWDRSLQRLGTFCYQGIVPRGAITRYCRFDRSQYFSLTSFFSTPVIGLDEHQKQSGFQQRLIRLMFGDCDQLPQNWQHKCQERRTAPGIEVVVL